MFNFKELLGLSDEGYRDFKRGVIACIIANIILFIPFGIIIFAIITLLDPFMSGNPLDTTRLWLLFGASLAAAVLYFFAYSSEYHRTYTVAYSESEKIRIEVAERMRRLPLSFFNNKDLSELTTNIMADCASIEHTMSHVTPGLFADSITITLACLGLAFFDWRMALAMFVAFPIALGMIFLTRRLASRLGEAHVKAKLEVADQVQEYLEGIKVVKAFGLAGERSQSLKAALRSMMRQAIKFEGIVGMSVTLGMMVLQVGIGLVVLVGVMLLSGGSLDAVKFLTFLVISSRIYGPLIVVLTLLPEFFYLLVSTRRMRELRHEPLMEGSTEVALENCAIELRDVSFAYGDTDVLSNLTLSIPENAVTALVGPSGSGKTTVSRLIARFWDVRGGEILIGGRNIREIDPEHLMASMGFVFQDVVLFNDTVMNNIRIGKKDASDEEVFAAARVARCEAFVRALPEGFETMIGENGSTLSGGERQRISIARALLKDAPILLLDEATASLDPENETEIQQALLELIKGRTVIVIAHRLRTVTGADNIAVLDGGRLIEQGTGEELLAANGLFAHLHAIQQKSLGWSVHND
jgi:ATP-binding cassette subfamily B protein